MKPVVFHPDDMKALLTFLVIPMLVAGIQFAPVVVAQTPPGESPSPRFLGRSARWARLNDEERAKLRAAYEKAMADPAVRAAHDKLKQARREFRELMRPALLRADPSIEPILEKMRRAKRGE